MASFTPFSAELSESEDCTELGIASSAELVVGPQLGFHVGSGDFGFFFYSNCLQVIPDGHCLRIIEQQVRLKFVHLSNSLWQGA